MSKFVTAVCVLASAIPLRAELSSVTSNLTTAGDVGGPNIANKSLHFVDILKDNLRKNNDDYIVDGVRRAHGKPGDTRRRFDDTPLNTPMNTASPSLVSPPSTDAPSTRAFLGGGTKTYKQMRVNDHRTTLDDMDRKMRVDKWKQLLEKNKRLRMYTSSPKIEPSSPVVAQRGGTENTRAGFSKRAKKSRVPAKRQLKPSWPAALNAFLPLRTPAGAREPPNADQLDMAPARGAYIHDLRQKGRFCHRNVLWPEGPKYDSKGNTIMPAFDTKIYKHKNFAETVKPLFVLPRCCNCCKKSVLGCQ